MHVYRLPILSMQDIESQEYIIHGSFRSISRHRVHKRHGRDGASDRMISRKRLLQKAFVGNY